MGIDSAFRRAMLEKFPECVYKELPPGWRGTNFLGIDLPALLPSLIAAVQDKHPKWWKISAQLNRHINQSIHATDTEVVCIGIDSAADVPENKEYEQARRRSAGDGPKSHRLAPEALARLGVDAQRPLPVRDPINATAHLEAIMSTPTLRHRALAWLSRELASYRLPEMYAAARGSLFESYRRAAASLADGDGGECDVAPSGASDAAAAAAAAAAQPLVADEEILESMHPSGGMTLKVCGTYVDYDRVQHDLPLTQEMREGPYHRGVAVYTYPPGAVQASPDPQVIRNAQSATPPPPGEAEVQVVRELCAYVAEKIRAGVDDDVYCIIETIDGDAIFGVMLNLQYMVDPRTGMFPPKVHILVKARQQYIDVPHLMYCVCRLVRSVAPAVTRPVEFFAMAVSLAGTDYCEGLPNLGGITVWNVISDHGWASRLNPMGLRYAIVTRRRYEELLHQARRGDRATTTTTTTTTTTSDSVSPSGVQGQANTPRRMFTASADSATFTHNATGAQGLLSPRPAYPSAAAAASHSPSSCASSSSSSTVSLETSSSLSASSSSLQHATRSASFPTVYGNLPPYGNFNLGGGSAGDNSSPGTSRASSPALRASSSEASALSSSSLHQPPSKRRGIVHVPPPIYLTCDPMWYDLVVEMYLARAEKAKFIPEGVITLAAPPGAAAVDTLADRAQRTLSLHDANAAVASGGASPSLSPEDEEYEFERFIHTFGVNIPPSEEYLRRKREKETAAAAASAAAAAYAMATPNATFASKYHTPPSSRVPGQMPWCHNHAMHAQAVFIDGQPSCPCRHECIMHFLRTKVTSWRAPLPSDDLIMAIIRRAMWQVVYWASGAVAAHPFPDPFETNAQGVSKWGYAKQTDPVTRTYSVVLTTRVERMHA